MEYTQQEESRVTSNPIQVTNGWIANKMRYSESGVSLLRRGLRSPALTTMKTIAEAIGWPLADQAKALEALDWHAQFNSRMAQAFEDELKTTTTTKEK